ncbi:MAG: signal peptidase I [Acidobacteriota bacterium]
MQQSTIREYFESLVVTVILALFGTTFIVQAFKIPTPSMEDNLLVGDHLLVNKYAFARPCSWGSALLPLREIHRGDVIVFKYPEDLTKHYVKRVIGMPGDHLRIVNQKLYLNGQAVDEPYVFHKMLDRNNVPVRDNFPVRNEQLRRLGDYHLNQDIFDSSYYFEEYLDGDEIVVPEGYYFAMGDNRDNSADSRYWGFVPRKNIVGRALIIYWSFVTDSNEHLRTSFVDRTQQIGDVILNFFSKTRWSRTFKLVR